MVSVYASEEIEQLRKRSRRFAKVKTFLRFLLVFVVLALFGISFYVISSSKEQNNILFLVMAAVFALIIGMSLFDKKVLTCKEEFKTLYKNSFVKQILYENLNQVEYIPDQGFSREQVKASRLVSLASRFNSEDYLKAEYNGVIFEQSDVKIVQRRQKQADIVQFKGRMLKLTCPNKQMSDMQIFTENFKYRASSVNGKPMVYGMIIPAGANMPGITQTNDQEFNKQFDVYAVNESEALYMLSPSMMETYKRLKNKYSSVAFRFVGNEVYIAMNSSRDTFDCNDKKEIDYEAEAIRIVDDVNEIKMLIDALV